MKPVKQNNKKFKTYYKTQINTHKRYQEMLDRLIPKGEDDPLHWWVYSYLKGNQIKIR